MRRSLVPTLAVTLALTLAACSASPSAAEAPASPGDAGAAELPGDASTPDAADATADAGLTGTCADTFGSALTTGFGRIDGVVYAVQKPSDTACVMPNSDHVVVQVLMGGAVYRMVVNVSASASDPTIRTATLAHELPAPAWSEGWHAAAPLDYVTSLAAHDAAFTTTPMADAVAAIASALHVGDPVSVYATCGAGRPESAHLVHRNKTGEDGAIVVSPNAQPSFFLFAFSNQTF
jgi:hypothetical protein